MFPYSIVEHQQGSAISDLYESSHVEAPPVNEDSDEEDKKSPPRSPLAVFADIECYQDEDRVFYPNLICWSSAEEDEIHHSDSIEDFLAALEDLT